MGVAIKSSKAFLLKNCSLSVKLLLVVRCVHLSALSLYSCLMSSPVSGNEGCLRSMREGHRLKKANFIRTRNEVCKACDHSSSLGVF